MTRQMKTPRQRAEETLAAAERRVERTRKHLDHQRSLVALHEAELEQAQQRLTYAQQDPALVDAHLDDTTTPGETR